MRLPGLLLLAAAVAVSTACGERDDTQRVAATNALAAEVDRMATMLAEDRPCEALVATRTIELLANDDHVDAEVRDAVLAHVDGARQAVECAPRETASDEPPPPDEGDKEENDDDKKDDDKDDDGDDKDDDEGDGPGQGNGNGRGPPGDR